MEQASGVYATITSESIQSSVGSQNLRVIIPMITNKGNIGLNMVTAKNFKDVLGYEENSAYFGLERILESVSYAYVWRLNKGATIGNARIETSGASVTHPLNAPTTIDSIIKIDENTNAYMAVGYKTSGEHKNAKVKFAPLVKELNASATGFTLKNISTTDTGTICKKENALKSCVIYDASGTQIIGVLSNGYVYSVEDGVAKESSCGTYTTTGDLTVTISEPLSGDSYVVVRYYTNEDKDWTLTLIENGGSATYLFSTDKESDIYYENVDFGDLFLSLGTGKLEHQDALNNEIELTQSGKGEMPTPNQIDTTILDTCGCNMLAMNGITDYAVVVRLANKCEQRKIHMFVDAPVYSRYMDLYDKFISKIPSSKYIHICARPDQTKDSEGKIVYIYPSVNYIQIYGSMLQNFGFLNYPPAGATYGSISAENLIECDYENFADELKTNRCNWQRTTSQGTMIWEQRKTHAVNDDFSYIAPVFIIDQLVDDIIAIEINYNFRYMTPTDLLNQESAISSLLDQYVSNSFLYNYEFKMPSYKEAQESGRTLIIPIQVAVMKDSEVIKLNIKLVNG